MPEVLGTRCTCLVCFTELMSMKKFVPPTDQREVDEMYREMLSRVEQGILLVPSTRARIEQAIVEKHKAKDMKAVRALAFKDVSAKETRTLLDRSEKTAGGSVKCLL